MFIVYSVMFICRDKAQRRLDVALIFPLLSEIITIVTVVTNVTIVREGTLDKKQIVLGQCSVVQWDSAVCQPKLWNSLLPEAILYSSLYFKSSPL